MNIRPIATGVAVLAAVAVIAGCSDSTDSSPHSGHDMSSMSAPASANTSRPAHNAADVMFAQMMIPHHRQAVTMSEILLAKQGVPSDVRTLATSIKGAQAPEVEQLTGWLTEWGEPTQTEMSDHRMDGMVSEADLTRLEDAVGAEAAALYLRQMIGHHEGAVDMAKTEIANGENTDAVAMAHSIVATQQKEIDRMRTMLE
ncbi:DUF305 domain-containing protein [Gordonia humi]|uniref:Uncharacterized protein (DUF305 family) n=1 Tax=Gordonia humi TaxID=686429 RepID=A0A840EZS7_9ACTN|nr:DUF305 domain-containing protein [Gordonia humi]MBB4137111.1 uncharacterized protein (DUF305 family) [Gordonia humi]